MLWQPTFSSDALLEEEYAEYLVPCSLNGPLIVSKCFVFSSKRYFLLTFGIGAFLNLAASVLMGFFIMLDAMVSLVANFCCECSKITCDVPPCSSPVLMLLNK